MPGRTLDEEAMDSYATTPNKSAGRAFVRFLVVLLLLGMAGGIGFLLSQINAHTYTLEVLDGKLTVFKGKLLPYGADPYRPSDPRLADAYAPIALEGKSAEGLLTERFTDRDELDRALFTFLKDVADPKVTSDDPKAVDQGIGLLARMEKLSGITEDQRGALQRMQAEVAFDQAKIRLDQARQLIAGALSELKVAADSSTRHSQAAHQMVSSIEPAAKALEESLRTAVHTTALQETPASGQSAPAAQAAPAASAPTATPQSP
jgi:hypothetical protein